MIVQLFGYLQFEFAHNRVASVSAHVVTDLVTSEAGVTKNTGFVMFSVAIPGSWIMQVAFEYKGGKICLKLIKFDKRH